MATATQARTPAHEAQQFFFEIGMAQRTRVGAKLGRLGLSFAQAHALRMLEPDEPLPMSALADRLEARGLVERRSAEGDRRVKALTITPAGLELREVVLEIMSEPPEAIAALPQSDQRALRDILARAVEILRER
jgi:DNA-binding MarR family transcriptional regulator